MQFEVTVKIEDRDYTYELEFRKLLQLLGITKTDEEILNAIREQLRTQ